MFTQAAQSKEAQAGPGPVTVAAPAPATPPGQDGPGQGRVTVTILNRHLGISPNVQRCKQQTPVSIFSGLGETDKMQQRVLNGLRHWYALCPCCDL